MHYVAHVLHSDRHWCAVSHDDNHNRFKVT